MDLRRVIYLCFLALVGLWLAFFSNLEIVSLIRIDLIFVLTFYVYDPGYRSVLISLLYLFIIDPIRGSSMIISPLSYTLVGLLLSISNALSPIFKKKPFILPRNLFLLLMLVFIFFMQHGISQSPNLRELGLTIAINHLILNAIIIFLEPLFNRNNATDFAI
jgi:hypothetical protein